MTADVRPKIPGWHTTTQAPYPAFRHVALREPTSPLRSIQRRRRHRLTHRWHSGSGSGCPATEAANAANAANAAEPTESTSTEAAEAVERRRIELSTDTFRLSLG